MPAKKKITEVAPVQDVELKTYELMFILKPSQTEKDRNAMYTIMRGFIESAQGEVFFEDTTWGERQLAYPVKNFFQGYYVVWGIKMPGSALKEFSTSINLESEVLKYMYLEVPQGYEFKKYEEVKEHIDFIASKAPAKAAPAKPAPKKVEKKLDDVLSENI